MHKAHNANDDEQERDDGEEVVIGEPGKIEYCEEQHAGIHPRQAHMPIAHGYGVLAFDNEALQALYW